MKKKKEPAQLHTVVCSQACDEGLVPFINTIVAAALEAAQAPRRGKYKVECKHTKKYEGSTHRLTAGFSFLR